MRQIFAFLLITLLLAACGGTATTTPEPVGLTPAPSNTPAPTVGPTATIAPPLAILVFPEDLNDDTANAYQSLLYDLSESVGYRFQVRNSLNNTDLEPALKIVVALLADPGIASLAAAAPQTQFLAVNIPGVQAGGNVSVLGGENIKVEHQAFMAGYIGALVTEDYRTGILIKKDSPEGANALAAFTAGHQFYCGLCRPFAMPLEEYPLFVEIPQDAKPEEYGAYTDFLLRKKVETLFFQPGLDTPEVLDYLNTVGAYVIGTRTPIKDYPGWVVTLQPDYLHALEPAFLELVAGQGGKTFSPPLTFTDINEEIFSVGKQNLALEVMNEMFAGFIDIGVKP